MPASFSFPHDAVGSDHDSVGLFQQRQAGWGSIAERMNPFGSAKLFFNKLNTFNWRAMAPGAAAQRVQVSAFPGRYAGRMGEAGRLLDIHAGGGFDDGGQLPRGMSMVWNGTKGTEPVLTDDQWDIAQRGMDRAVAGDRQITDAMERVLASRPISTTWNVNVTIPAKDLKEMSDVAEFFDRVQQTARQGGTNLVGVRT